MRILKILFFNKSLDIKILCISDNFHDHADYYSFKKFKDLAIIIVSIIEKGWLLIDYLCKRSRLIKGEPCLLNLIDKTFTTEG